MSEQHSEENAREIPLADTIQTLRKELQLAQSRSVNEDVLFSIDKVELELKVVVGRTTKGEGGVQFYVLKAGGGIETSGETTHNVKLTLTPRTSTGGRFDVSNETTEGPLRG